MGNVLKGIVEGLYGNNISQEDYTYLMDLFIEQKLAISRGSILKFAEEKYIISDYLSSKKACTFIINNTKEEDILLIIYKEEDILSKAYAMRAFINLNSFKLEEAVSDVSNAIRLTPHERRAFLYFLKAEAIHRSQKNHQEAYESMKMALQLEPNNKEYKIKLEILKKRANMS